MAQEPSAVLFDLDGTLCEYERSSDEVLQQTFDRLDVDHRFEMGEFHQRYTEFLRDATDARDLYVRCFTALARDAGFGEGFGREIADTFLDERPVDTVEPRPGAAEAVRTLAETSAVGLVTNGHPDLQRQKLAAIGLDGSFETEVFAGYDTPAKPARDPFERALTELDTAPEAALYVGNSPSIDVVGARNAGLQSALVRNGVVGETNDPTFLFESLHELLDDPW